MRKLCIFICAILSVCCATHARSADCFLCQQRKSRMHCKTCPQCAGNLASQQLLDRSNRTSPLAQQYKPKRILVVTTLDRQDRLKEQATLVRRITSELRLKGGVDTVESTDRMCEDFFPIRTGTFDEHRLVDLGKKYRVDSILYCNVESIDAYRPMRMEVQFLLVNVEESVALVSGSRLYDLGDANTLKQFFEFMNADPDVGQTLPSSPTRLIDFGASRLAGDLTSLWR